MTSFVTEAQSRNPRVVSWGMHCVTWVAHGNGVHVVSWGIHCATCVTHGNGNEENGGRGADRDCPPPLPH